MAQNLASSPFVLRFRTPVVYNWIDPVTDPEVRRDENRLLWVDNTGTPLWAGGRSSKIYTPCSTSGKTIPAGWTPSGKYKPSTYRPPRMDKRAGK
jgi:hypothetical protein